MPQHTTIKTNLTTPPSDGDARRTTGSRSADEWPTLSGETPAGDRPTLSGETPPSVLDDDAMSDY
jgi:hypothetical protein